MSSPEALCVHCRAPLESFISRHVCEKCGEPQPLILDGQRTSSENYFSALGVKPRFSQDGELLQKRFYEASRALHPDRFAVKSEQARKLSLERMSFLNEAYSTLKNPARRRQALLEVLGYSLSPAAAVGQRSHVPMELAEAWFEVQDAGPGARIREFEAQMEAFRGEIERRAHVLEETIDRSLDEGGPVAPDLLEKLAREMRQQSYLVSLRRDVERIKAGSTAGSSGV